MGTETRDTEQQETPEPGKPLRPDPGSPETRGGSMEPSTLEDLNSSDSE